MNRHAQAVRVTGAALAATTTFGLFGPAAHAGAVEQTVPLTRPALSVVGGVPAPSANAATPTVKAVAPTAKKASTYTVRSGDTLWDIAKKNGTSVSAIAKANGIDESAYLQIGQKLTIPGKSNSSTQFAPASSGKAASSTSGKRHVVVSGETLSSIALKYGTTPGAIQKSNSLANPNRIYVGQVLSIGGKASSSSSSSSSSSNSVGNTFLHYTYSESTTSAANANKDKLVAGKAPSKAQMQQIIRDTAVSMGVDPSLALAHAQVESGFDQRAVSPANAIGAMQVIPSSGEWASSLVGRNLNLLDPYDNATAGVAIIKQLQATASSKDQGIAAYYQGLAGVRKNGMYPDTKNYVAKVKAAQANY